MVQGGFEIQCLLIFSSKKRDLLDNLQKLLTLNIEKVEEMFMNDMAKDKEIAADNEMALETTDDVCLTIHDFWTMV